MSYIIIIIQSQTFPELYKDTGNNYKSIEQTYMTVVLPGFITKEKLIL
jgi:hypothetical protein